MVVCGFIRLSTCRIRPSTSFVDILGTLNRVITTTKNSTK
ncbi:unnamed protein product [Schistosoma mattheei]|uniref:Uncharacterized protein n=1 Tax=Schistosoma mattheei TaxID=31246 RepID=A0A183PBH9_9TREM|nr:unnamed protein product [Schistosoma mattheei]